MRVLVSGGGTGGHIYPILAVAGALRQKSESRLSAQPLTATESELHHAAGPSAPIDAWAGATELCYVGEAGGMEEGLAERVGIPFHSITSGQIRGRAPWIVARNLLRMARGARQCTAVLDAFRPDAVFLTGGYVTAPVAWAAWRHRRSGRKGVPILIYLPDLTPGLAVRLTSYLARRVAVSFPEVVPHFGGKAVVTGYPVRSELLAIEKGAARAALALRDDLPVLLVFGGSRGAHSINEALLAALPAVLQRCQVVHISGQLDWPRVSGTKERQVPPDIPWDNYHAYPYLHEEMMQALAAADLVIARAGASTLGEFPAAALPSILVPYPYAGQHQDANAAYLADRGAAIIIEDRQLSSNLVPAVLQLLDEPGRLSRMSEAAAALARPEAACKIAEELRRLAHS